MKTNSLTILLSFIIILLSSCKKREYEELPPKVTNEVQPTTRIYYIAAVEQIWDYSPQAMNVFMGMPYDATDSIYTINIAGGPTPRIGSRNLKARYIEYTDTNFNVPKGVSPEWQHLGVLGPVIRANVGDSIIVYFKNKTSIDASLHAHGVLYDVNSEGAVYNNGAISGSSLATGKKYMYKYFVRETSGPSPSQGSSIVWLYHSHVNMDESDMYAGLIGTIIISKKGMGDENAKPKDVDREFVTMFMVMDENHSALLERNTDIYCNGFTNPNPDDFEESNKKHSINGMLMGNLPGLVMNQGEKVRWYVVALGNEVDLHTPHWHGNTVNVYGHNTDVVELLPATMVTADMVPDNPGVWGYHCHVTDHMVAGMTALYTVN